MVALRLIAFDLDGTVLNTAGEISDYTAAVLARAAAVENLLLVAASGRGHPAAEHVLSRVEGIDYVICSNGALLYRPRTGQRLWRWPMSSELVREFYREVNAGLEGVCWAWDTTRGIVPDDRFRAVAALPGRQLDELLASPRLDLVGSPDLPIDRRLAPHGRVLRQLILHPELNCLQVYRELKDCMPGRLTRSSASFLEITAPDVNKLTALQKLCERKGIRPEEVVAFGDHVNDRLMLQWAGRGIAMCDGYPDLLRVIAEHTDFGHDEDGAARKLEEILDEL